MNTKRDEYNGTTYPAAPISRITLHENPEILNRKTKITLLGDSLVCEYYDGRREDDLGSNQTGWGQQLSNFVDMEKYELVNLANSGHYAKILYETAMGGAIYNSLPGDIIILQCGYNDYKRSSETEMVAYMTKMAEEAKAAGLTMIVVAPPATCDPEEWLDHTADGYKNTSYTYPVRFGKTVEETAKRLGVGFIDLSRFSYDFLTSLYGDELAVAGELYKNNLVVKDYIHLSYAGAMKWASFVVQSLYDQDYLTEVNADFSYAVTDTEGNAIECGVNTGAEPFPTPRQTNQPQQSIEPTAGPVTKPTVEPTKPPSAKLEEVYREDFSNGDKSKWKGSVAAASIQEGGISGNYISLEPGTNDRGIYTLFQLQNEDISEYVFECDVQLKSGNNKSSQVTLMSKDYVFNSDNVNYGVSDGYILKLNTINSEEWTINPDTDNRTVILPKTDWVHLSIYYNNTDGRTSLEITEGGSVLYAGDITPKTASSVPCGFFMRGGKNNAVMAADNIVLKTAPDESFKSYMAFRNSSKVGVMILPEVSGVVYAALYNSSGALLGSKIAVPGTQARTLSFPLPEEAGTYMKIFNWSDNMQPLCETSRPVYTDTVEGDPADYVLKGKTIYAFGDSIVYGHTAPDKSFTRLIADEYDMSLTMKAVNGASVIKSDNHILTQIKAAPEEAPDVILFDGYTNDAYAQTFHVLGEIKGSAAREFDETTFCGSFENIIYTLQQKWPETPIVFVTIHKSGGRDWDIQCKLRELSMEMCKAWGIQVADVFEDTDLDTRDAEQMKKYIIGGAGSHPNVEACKEFYIPVVTKALQGVLASEDTVPENINDTVDLAVFAGQSNMSGRGTAVSAVPCDINAGFEYKAVGNPHTLVPVTEPFGIGEEREGGIADNDSKGKTKRSGSMVSALADEYYKRSGRQLVAVSASIGGTSSAQWKELYIKDAVSRLDAAKAFLQKNGINVGSVFVVWCQGETDGDYNVSAEEYMKNTREVFDLFKAHGAEKCFMVQTGHYNYLDYPNGNDGIDGKAFDSRYGVIRSAQEKLCAEQVDFVLSASFEPYIDYMKDRYHYNQEAYNEVGKTCGRAIADFFKQL